jgi:FkbM family methyltransferase
MVRSLDGADGTEWATLRSGERILVNPLDYVGRSLAYFGDLDPKITWLCRKLLRQGDVVLDIGANQGLITLTCASLVGARGKVHAFEPNPELARLLNASIVQNGFTNVVVHEVALGSRTEKRELFVPPGNAGAGSLVPEGRMGRSGRSLRISVHNTTEYLSGLDLERIRLIKIDVEGFEAEVIGGGLEFFKGTSPDAILFELNEAYSGIHPTIALLRELGYVFFHIPRALMRMRVRRIDPVARPREHGRDLLAVPSGAAGEAIVSTLG